MKRIKEFVPKSVFLETRIHKYSYHFTCEKCGTETQWIEEEIISEHSTSKKNMVGINADKMEKVSSIAEHTLNARIDLIKDDIQNGTHQVSNDKCPSCNRKQSWSIKNRDVYDVVGIVFTLFFWGVILELLIPREFILHENEILLLLSYVLIFFMSIMISFFIRRYKKHLFIKALKNNKLEFDNIL